MEGCNVIICLVCDSHFPVRPRTGRERRGRTEGEGERERREKEREIWSQRKRARERVRVSQTEKESKSERRASERKRESGIKVNGLEDLNAASEFSHYRSCFFFIILEQSLIS